MDQVRKNGWLVSPAEKFGPYEGGPNGIGGLHYPFNLHHTIGHALIHSRVFLDVGL